MCGGLQLVVSMGGCGWVGVHVWGPAAWQMWVGGCVCILVSYGGLELKPLQVLVDRSTMQQDCKC